MNSKITALLEQMKGYIARMLQRDSDTLARFNNHGVLHFLMFHEWNDSYDPATGETGTITGETYDSASDTFAPATTAGVPVFNGRLSGIWDLISTCFPSELESMYGKMRAAGFNADAMWQLYQSFRTQWCEALYNADAMGYANTGRFDMAYGDKNEAMRAFFRQRFRYLDSKYGQNTASTVVMRLWGNGQGVAVRHYCPIYASLNWGAGAVKRIRSIKPGEPAYFENPGVTFNDTTVTLYDADLITEISSYSTLTDGSREESGLQKLGSSLMFSQGLGNCKRLKSLVLDYSGGEANTQATASTLDAAGSVALRRMVVRNCPNVTGHPVFVSQVIEEIDLRGTGVTGITVPETDTLTTLRLPEVVSVIELAHMGGLSDLSVDSAAALRKISIEDCPKVDVRPILYEALNASTLQEVRIIGVDYKNLGVKYLEKLTYLGAELTGSIALAAADNMSFALKQKCIAVWGDIDSEENPLHITYTQRPVDIIRISGAGYFAEPGDYQLTVISDDPYANDFTKIEWAMTANGYAEIDTLTGRVHVSRVGSKELAPTAEVTVTVTKADGTTVTKSTSVGFYERACQLADFVYADGSYSDIFDEGRTVVAICCYIDPDNPALRLGVCPRPVITNVAWGGYEKLTLTDDPTYDSRYVPTLPILNCSELSDENLRDETEEDGWKRYDVTSANRCGFSPLTADLMQFDEGDDLPIGKAQTLKAILHRNKVLRDSGINLPVPVKAGDVEEWDNLRECIKSCNASTSNKSFAYYWPAFSYAYAYEPKGLKTGEELSSKFKAHNWFLGCAFDYARIAWLNKYDDRFLSLYNNAYVAFGNNVTSSCPGYWAGTSINLCNNMISIQSYKVYPIKNECENDLGNCTVLPMVVF